MWFESCSAHCLPILKEKEIEEMIIKMFRVSEFLDSDFLKYNFLSCLYVCMVRIG